MRQLRPNQAGYSRQATVARVFDGETVAAGGSAVSDAIDVSMAGADLFSLQMALSGDGTITLSYLVSVDGTNFLTPTGASDIGASLTKTSGPGSDGKDIFSFNPELAPFIKVKATETGSTNGVTLTADLAVK